MINPALTTLHLAAAVGIVTFKLTVIFNLTCTSRSYFIHFLTFLIPSRFGLGVE